MIELSEKSVIDVYHKCFRDKNGFVIMDKEIINDNSNKYMNEIFDLIFQTQLWNCKSFSNAKDLCKLLQYTSAGEKWTENEIIIHFLLSLFIRFNDNMMDKLDFMKYYNFYNDLHKES